MFDIRHMSMSDTDTTLIDVVTTYINHFYFVKLLLVLTCSVRCFYQYFILLENLIKHVHYT